MPGRFKDYIAMPKLNGYRSLHTTVIGPEGRPLEIQVRTREMHETAEFGIAAHWPTRAARRREGRTRSGRLGEPADGLDAGRVGPARVHEVVRTDLFEDEVFVFTPKGEVKTLPAGATPIDFAYAVHTDVGHRTVGAKVNGRIVPLHYQLTQRRPRRDPDVEVGPRPVTRLDLPRGLVPRAQQDPPVVLARAAARTPSRRAARHSSRR